jgi:hypothetical protein
MRAIGRFGKGVAWTPLTGSEPERRGEQDRAGAGWNDADAWDGSLPPMLAGASEQPYQTADSGANDAGNDRCILPRKTQPGTVRAIVAAPIPPDATDPKTDQAADNSVLGAVGPVAHLEALNVRARPASRRLRAAAARAQYCPP